MIFLGFREVPTACLLSKQAALGTNQQRSNRLMQQSYEIIHTSTLS